MTTTGLPTQTCGITHPRIIFVIDHLAYAYGGKNGEPRKLRLQSNPNRNRYTGLCARCINTGNYCHLISIAVVVPAWGMPARRGLQKHYRPTDGDGGGAE